MKYSTIYHGDSKIELHNSILGKETVIVDEVQVSEKYSFAGTIHRFTIKENGADKQAQLTTKLTINGVAFDLFVDNKPIIEIPENNGVVFFFFMMVILISTLFIFT